MKKLMVAAAFVFALVVSGSVPAANPSDWETFSPDGEQFAIRFPSTPLSQTKTEKTPFGALRMKMFMDQTDSVAYVLGVVELPPAIQQNVAAAPEATLNGFALGFIKGSQGKLISQDKIKVGAYQGLELKASVFAGAGTARCQVILTKDRLYMLMVAAPADQDVSAETKAFFASFKLKEMRVGL